jgi:phage shock protein C
MAEYLELDPTLIRILWILSALFGGFTIVLYVILAFVIPVAPAWAYRAPGVPGTAGAPATAGAPTTGAGPAGDADAAAFQAGAAAGAEGQSGPSAERGPIEGWITSPAWTPSAGWAAPAGPDAAGRRGPGAAFYAGILLLVFGALALGNAVIPGLAGAIHLGPALLVAIGAALLIGSMRRTADES